MMSLRPWSVVFLLTVACTGPDPDSWKTAADCEGIGADDVRDECYSRVSTATFTESAEAGEAMLAKVTDPLVRDYILLKVTREVDPTSFRFCEQIQDDRLEERCRVLVRRPHLHRDLVGGGGGPEGPGQPGGGGPPPKPPGPPPRGQ